MWQIIDSYLGVLITMSGIVAFGGIVLAEKVKISKKKLVISMIIICLMHLIISQYLNGTLKTLVISLINMCTYKYMYNIRVSRAILLTFLCTILLVVPDVIEMIIATEIIGISKEFYYTKFAGSTIGNLSICISLLILTYFMRKPLRKLLYTKIENNKKIIIYLLLTLICIAIVFYQAFSNIEISINLIISIFIMLTFVIILFSLIKQTLDNEQLTIRYDKLLEYMVTYEQEIEKQRTLRHEVKNEFRIIRAKICDKQENKEIIEYIDEIVNDKYEVNKEKYAKFGYLPPNGIKGLCYFKAQEAEEKGINVAINISKRTEKSTIFKLNVKQQRDFGKILGVFLDNAIEASENSKEKQLGIEAYVNNKKECKIIISNTYKGKIDKKKIGKEVFSTKGKTRGHGLLLVKQLVGNNSLFETKTDIQDKIYIQTILIKETK